MNSKLCYGNEKQHGIMRVIKKTTRLAFSSPRKQNESLTCSDVRGLLAIVC